MTLVPTSTPDSLVTLRRGLAELDDQRKALAEAGDYETLIYGLVQLLPLVKDLSELARAVKQDIAATMPSRWVEIEGVGRVERKPDNRRSDWDWDQLLPRLIRMYVDPDGNGALPEPAEVMDRMRELIVDVIGVTPSKGPRVTPLREMGLDPDEWCSVTRDKHTVQIHGGEK